MDGKPIQVSKQPSLCELFWRRNLLLATALARLAMTPRLFLWGRFCSLLFEARLNDGFAYEFRSRMIKMWQRLASRELTPISMQLCA